MGFSKPTLLCGRSIFRFAAVALFASALAAGCGDDDDEEGTGGSSGRGGSAGTAGRDGSAGTSGKGGTSGTGGMSSGGTAGSGGSAGSDASAGTGGSSPDGGAEAGDAGIATLSVETHSTLGEVVAANGKTLYIYGGDTPGGTNTDSGAPTAPAGGCTANCLRPFYSGSTDVTDGLSAADFGDFDRGGNLQATYKGWPVYTSDGDSAPGDANADGQDDLWHAVTVPFYSVVTMRRVVTYGGDAGVPITYLADGKGLALYIFTDDTPAADGGAPLSACGSPNCLRAWPPTAPLGSTGKIVSSVSRSDFDAFTWTPPPRDGGATPGPIDHMVYKGWPIYYWWRDYVPGETTGQCRSGGTWLVAEINGNWGVCE
jgi:predicted lipoprotein with Yx(FWY)xxD motif